MNKKKKRKGFDRGGMRCPYCGSPVVYRSADGIYRDNSKGTMLYVCSRYPECDSYVRAHTGTNIPVGSMANHELRTLRRTAHHYFDQLYESGYMSKQDAYQWLADLIVAPLSEAHIGYLGEYYCKQVIEESRKLLEQQKAKTRGRYYTQIPLRVLRMCAEAYVREYPPAHMHECTSQCDIVMSAAPYSQSFPSVHMPPYYRDPFVCRDLPNSLSSGLFSLRCRFWAHQ